MSERHPNGSETQEGPDWWLASDNRWYPPELHPEFRNARSVVIGDRGAISGPEPESPPSLLAGPDLNMVTETERSDTSDAVPGLLGTSAETTGAQSAQSDHSQPDSNDPYPDTNPAEPDVIDAQGDVTFASADPAVTEDPAVAESPVAVTEDPAVADDPTAVADDPTAVTEDPAIEAIGTQDPSDHGADANPSDAERPPISIGTPLSESVLESSPEASLPESSTADAPADEDSSAVVNPWTLPVRGRFDSEAVTSSDPDGDMASSSSHRIVLPGQLESDPSPQPIRPSGPTPVAKSLTFRPAEPTTVQAAVSVPTADDTPWYQRPVDGSDPGPTTPGQNTPNIYGGALSVAGGALAIVGALMTWATETGPLLDGFLWARKVPGFASNGGWVLVCGLLMGVAGVLSIIGIKPTGVWSIMSIVSGGLVLAAVLYSYADIVGAASEDWRTFVSASTGIDAVTLKARGVGLRPAFGLWLSAIAGLLGCGAGIYFKRDF